MKKLLCCIFALVIALGTVCISSCAKQPDPKIEEGEFAFVFEYEKDGKVNVIEDTVVCYFNGHDSSSLFKVFPRKWHAYLKNRSDLVIARFDEPSDSFIKEGRRIEGSYISLDYGEGGYYMGDPDYASKKPHVSYSESYVDDEGVRRLATVEISYEKLEEYFGIKVTRHEFSEPISNVFG